jgi:hypothetical protein
MIKVFFLIFEPGAAWEKLSRARHGFLYITVVHLFPLISLGTSLEAWGLAKHGKWQPHFQMMNHFSKQVAVTFGIIEFLLLFAVVFASALMVFKISQTFQDRQPFLQAFTVIAYGFSPLFLVRFLDFFGMMHPAVTWVIGIGLTVWILYQGIPRVMQPDPTHAFGIYLSSTIVVILTSGLARLLTAMFMLGYMDLQNSWLAHKIAQFLGHNPFAP